MHMTSQDPVYITGHQHPDTDSIASAIAYSFFKRSMGIRAIPCRLSDITLDPPTYIKPDTTIFESLRQMEEQGHTYCGVVDDDMHLLGLVTKGDIAQVGLGDTHHNIDILSKTPLDNFVKTLGGKLIYRDDEMHLNGKVSMIAMAEIAQLDAYQIEDRIVILGSNSVAQRHAIERGAGLLIIVWANSVEIWPVTSGDSKTLGRSPSSMSSFSRISFDQQRLGTSNSCMPLASETSVAYSPVITKRT